MHRRFWSNIRSTGSPAVMILGMFVFAHAVQAQGVDADQIDQWFERIVDEQGFSGAVLIAQGGRILLDQGYGLADDESATPMTPGMIVATGSISKQFTAAAVLKLQARGLLNVNDSIARFLPNVPQDRSAITIHHLLTHTAGFTTDHFDHDLTPMSLDEALAAIYALELGAPPGERYVYSNTGYALLAAIVQNVSGQPFTEFMDQMVFEPAGLTSTGFFSRDWSSHTVATAYRNGIAQGKPSTFPGPFWGNMGNGGVLSTTADLYRWFHALRSDEIIGSAAGTAEMFTPHVRVSENLNYGYGWAIGSSDYGPIVVHSGLGLGGNSDLAYFPERELTVIILCNRAAFGSTDGVAMSMWRPATEARIQLTRNLVAADFSALPERSLTADPSGHAMTIVVGMLLGGGTLLLFVRRARRRRRMGIQ